MKLKIVKYEKILLNLNANVGDEVKLSKEQVNKIKNHLNRELKVAKKHKDSDPFARREYSYCKKRLEYIKERENLQ